jgi:membrane protein implicated in regulation of membrane protease activity
MEMLFENLNFMHWLVLGLSLIILELFLWTVFLLWIGASAITVSIFFYLMPDTSWPIQLLIFVILSLTTTNLAKRYYPIKTVDDELHEKAKTFIGKECKVSSIEDGIIKVQIGKSLWFAKGKNLSIGQVVKIINVESSTFIVEPVDS